MSVRSRVGVAGLHAGLNRDQLDITAIIEPEDLDVAPTIAALTAQIRENNIAKGWRSAGGGPGDNTLGDYIALLLTEAAEATEAYRDYRLRDATKRPEPIFQDQEIPKIRKDDVYATKRVLVGHRPAKPEGVGSELADMVIRLLDTGDVFGFPVADQDCELDDVADLDPRVSDPKLPALVTFGDHMAWLGRRIDHMWTETSTAPSWALRAVVTVARKYGFDLNAEVERKMAYNRTRSFRHGGRALSDTNA